MKTIAVKKKFDKTKGTKPAREGLMIIDENIKVYDDEGLLLAIFLKNVIPKKYTDIGRAMVKYKGKSTSRGAYAGVIEKKIIKSGKHKGERSIAGKSSNSALLGYLMPYLVKDPKPQLSKQTKKDLPYFNNEVSSLFNYYDKLINKIFKEQYDIQVKNLINVPEKVKISKTTTNIQLNYNQIAHFHEDKGNANAYGSITTYYPDGKPFKGGEFVLGNYGVAFNLKEGDFLYVNQSAIHGSLPSSGASRLSCVGFQSGRLINYYNRIKKMKGKGLPSAILCARCKSARVKPPRYKCIFCKNETRFGGV